MISFNLIYNLYHGYFTIVWLINYTDHHRNDTNPQFEKIATSNRDSHCGLINIINNNDLRHINLYKAILNLQGSFKRE